MIDCDVDGTRSGQAIGRGQSTVDEVMSHVDDQLGNDRGGQAGSTALGHQPARCLLSTVRQTCDVVPTLEESAFC